MRHLIVEACIARNLVDTSAYFWPGYVSTSATSPSDTSVVEKSPWETFMEGEPLNCSLVSSLSTSPASRYNGKISLFDCKIENLLLIDFLCLFLSLAEIETIYQIALNGSEEEKSAAAKILCGASLRRGWNIQVAESCSDKLKLEM